MEYSGNPDALAIYLKGESVTALLGRFKRNDEIILFTPAVPFTPGQDYEVREAGQKLAEFMVPVITTATTPKIIAVYPVQDSVPENLLKMYVYFSQPMQHVGNALNYITVYNITENKEESIFLALETELWNRQHDRLTLWLDPGRIKTDLIPNRELGLPLKEGNAYTVTIDKKWKTAAGQELMVTYQKHWIVTAPDTHKPDLKNWKLDVPPSNSMKVLTIYFDEALDHELAQQSLEVYDPEGTSIQGEWKLNELGTTLLFKPSKIWDNGTYEIVVDPKLEDFAGNSLQRLFDENLENFTGKNEDVPAYRIEFKITEEYKQEWIGEQAIPKTSKEHL